jgi:hypothetical protein
MSQGFGSGIAQKKVDQGILHFSYGKTLKSQETDLVEVPLACFPPVSLDDFYK